MVTIEVTQADIDGAIQTIENENDWDVCTVCPIARALNRTLSSSQAKWHVGEQVILTNWQTDFPAVRGRLPDVADTWRDKFDEDFNSVKPFTFEIGIDPAAVPA